MSSPLKVLVVDDSALMRSLIRNMLEQNPDIEVPAIAMHGQFALQKIDRFNIDVITLDLEMPVMNGIEFLKERQELGIDVPVIVFSSIAKKGAKITMEALSLGASDFILKPTGGGDDINKMQEQLTNLIKIYGNKYRETKKKKSLSKGITPEKTEVEKQEPIRTVYTPPPVEVKAPEPPVIVKKGAKGNTIDIVAIGISTGGPNALRQILPKLDRNLPVPVVIVQHMPPGFTEEFAKSLDRVCTLDVKEAKEGDILKPGRILIAQGGKHMEILQKPLANIITLPQTDAVNGHRPSVDVLFKSVASVYGNNCLAVIMTGMGKDGVREMGAIYRMGGITIAQDEESCIVPGMPGSAIRQGIIDKILPLQDIPIAINELVTQPR